VGAGFPHVHTLTRRTATLPSVRLEQ